MTNLEVNLPTIEQSIKEGLTLRAHLSPSGLRVASLIIPQQVYTGLGYGEGPILEQALIDLEYDLTHNHPSYLEVYGKPTASDENQKPRVKGDQEPSSPLDLWLLNPRPIPPKRQFNHLFTCQSRGNLVELTQIEQDFDNHTPKGTTQLASYQAETFLSALKTASPESLSILSTLTPTLVMRQQGTLPALAFKPNELASQNRQKQSRFNRAGIPPVRGGMRIKAG